MGEEIGKPKISLAVRSRVIPDSEILKLFNPGEVGCILDWEVRDTLTHELIEVGKKKSESFTQQFMEFLWVWMNAIHPMAGFLSKRTDAKSILLSSNYRTGAILGTAGTVVDGIIVGTGITAPQVTNYVMENPIGHGAGAGQLQYSAVTWGAPASDATTSQFTITRNFANASGAGITVNEIGLYNAAWVFTQSNSPVASCFMWLHDVIAGGILVGNGQTLTVNYRPQCVI